MDRIVGASADYLKSLLSTRKAQSGDSREDGSSRSDDYEQNQVSFEVFAVAHIHHFLCLRFHLSSFITLCKSCTK